MRRHWVHRSISEDGRAIAKVISSVSIPDDIAASVHRSASVRTGSDRHGSYSTSHSSVRVEWTAQEPSPQPED